MPYHTLKKQTVVFLFLLILSASLYAQKNDTVYMMNGDRITGEIKKYESGLLTLKTTGLGTLSIEYDKINSIHSPKFYEIVRSTGFSYFGTIVRSHTEHSIGIGVANDTVTESINNIVEIVPIKNRFWKKFYGSIDLGLSYYKSTKNLQYYISSDINFRAKRDLVSFNLDLLFNDQKINDSTKISTRNNNISLGLNHFFSGRWWGGIEIKGQQNTELELDYRLLLALGGGYDIVHTNPIRLYIMAGALVNREKPTDSVNASTNFEGIVAAKFTWLQYRSPKINISTGFNAFPSFTILGRIRLEGKLSVRYELVRDLFIELNLYDNYDNKPSGGGGALNDWGVVFAIGYSFG